MLSEIAKLLLQKRNMNSEQMPHHRAGGRDVAATVLENNVVPVTTRTKTLACVDR